jgi:hypothetical protein
MSRRWSNFIPAKNENGVLEQWSNGVMLFHHPNPPAFQHPKTVKQLYGLDRRAGINRRESQIKIVERKICQYV